MIFFKLINNKVLYDYETDRLGFPIGSEPIYDKNMIDEIEYIPLVSTSHAFGDWIILSAFPRIIKNIYPNKKILLPSVSLLKNMFYNLRYSWNQWNDPFKNVELAFANNPYIDGTFDSFGGEVLSDHYRIYNPNNLKEPLVKQMLRIYIKENDIKDVSPELYFSNEEIEIGESIIKNLPSYCSLILSHKHQFDTRDNELISIIKKYDNLFLYWSHKDIQYTPYNFIKHKIDITTLTKDLRIQLYIRSKSIVNFGTQSGVTDALIRYAPSYVIKHSGDDLTHGTFIENQIYIE